MSYVAIKGGEKAIRASREFFHSCFTASTEENDREARDSRQLPFACDRVMGEGALYTEKLAEKAIRQSGGDLLEAAFYVRAHRSTCRRIGETEIIEADSIRLLRRISSAFKDIDGGQILGPSCDYVLRLFSNKNAETGNMSPTAAEASSTATPQLQSALTPLRQADKVIQLANRETKPFDITRAFPLPPYPRSALMQQMARGETGAMLAFAYTSMRGYGDVHPTIGDLRLGFAEVSFRHPFTGNRVKVGEIRMTSCESVGSFDRDPRDGELRLSVGYGFTFGFNETKAIAMSILDLAMNYRGHSEGEAGIATSPEMVIHHVDAVEAMGFANHFKLPHYVTFQADLQVFANARENDEQQNRS